MQALKTGEKPPFWATMSSTPRFNEAPAEDGGKRASYRPYGEHTQLPMRPPLKTGENTSAVRLRRRSNRFNEAPAEDGGKPTAYANEDCV